MSDPDNLQFVPFTSYVDAGFLHTLSKNKLEVYGLDETPVQLYGFYGNGDATGLPSRFSLEFTAFNQQPQTPPRCFTAKGELHIKNSIEDFKTIDKKSLIENVGEKMWKQIINGEAEEQPEQLLRFILLMFVDMKKYLYYYWFAYPALCYPTNTILLKKPIQLNESCLKSKIPDILNLFDHTNPVEKPFFLLFCTDEETSLHSLNEFSTLHSKEGQLYLGFCDPSTIDSHPGWPLRNLLALAAVRWANITTVHQVFCFRDRIRDGKRSIEHSLLLSVELKVDRSPGVEPVPSVGWEKNERQKLGPRLMNMSSSMDPHKLSESSVDLNLKLMKWRLVPSLDVDKITHTRCLLLGSGTLGCNVARSLLGWGVRTITMVDNGKVSYSNPVRQTLFKFADCLNGGKPKAETAAEALKEIFPGVTAVGKTLSIPMPGHFVSDSVSEEVRQDVEELERLIESHDVIFLLMDTRESRWLPTVIAAARRKLVINAALGFDTYLVLRHGLKTNDDTESKPHVDVTVQNSIPGNELGCYFCNDVVAPGNSTKDRTLDQQCTVTRPGVSMLAAALAVELMVSVVHQPEGGLIPALSSTRDESIFAEQSTLLGIVPHQIRGFLSQFCHVLPASMAFDRCTACSTSVIGKYKSDGYKFLLEVFNKPSVLEDLTGLTDLHDETQACEVWELSD